MAVEYLRISLTDRCNLNCVYCTPLEKQGFLPHGDLLRHEFIMNLCRVPDETIVDIVDTVFLPLATGHFTAAPSAASTSVRMLPLPTPAITRPLAPAATAAFTRSADMLAWA